MAFNLDGPTFALSETPAAAAVYRSIRDRMRNLRELRKQWSELIKPGHGFLSTPAEGIHKIYQRYLTSSSTTPSRLADMNNDDVLREAIGAWTWLREVVNYHDMLLPREFEMRMFRSAIETQLGVRNGDWTERQIFYMAFTDGTLSLGERLEAGLAVALHYDLATRLRDVSEQARLRVDQLQRAKARDAALGEYREAIYERMETIVVDDFACAVPLQEIRETNFSIVDDNAGCCPICQNSYSDLSTNSIHDLFSDFPVRIKYCGHIFGKACLKQWMDTPKVNEARNPHKTCPTCRVQIENVATIPSLPLQLLLHLKSDGRALTTVEDLAYSFGMEWSDCHNAVKQAMSDEIAAEQLLAELPAYTTRYATEKAFLEAKLDAVDKERWAWGFRGDRLWKRLRDEWMADGVKR